MHGLINMYYRNSHEYHQLLIMTIKGDIINGHEIVH